MQWLAPGPSFHVPAGINGHKIAFISNSLDFPFTQTLLQGMKAAGTVVGVTISASNAETPDLASAQIQQAINNHVNAIALESTAEDSGPAIKAATQAGIPVILVLDQDHGVPTDFQKGIGVFGGVAEPLGVGGTDLADLAVSRSGCNIKSTVVGVPGTPNDPEFVANYGTEIQRLCGSAATTTNKQAPLPSWSTDLGPIATAAVGNSQDYIVPFFEAMIGLMQPAINAAGAQAKTGFLSYDIDAASLESLASGGSVKGLAASPRAWIGWAVIDQVLRAWAHVAPAAVPQIPIRVFTQSVAKTLNPSAPNGSWFGSVDYAAQFKALWNIS